MFIAHRGVVKGNIKENSIEAFKLAINDSYYSGFELDIRESKDHEFIVTHDFIYNNHLISKTNKDILIKEGLCLLDDVLNLDTDKLILIDIKDVDINIYNLIDKISKYNKNIYIMCYSKKVLNKLINSNYKIGILNMIYNSDHDYKKYDFIAILNNSISLNIINYFESKSVEIFVYGIINTIKYYNNNIYYIIDDKQKNKINFKSNY